MLALTFSRGVRYGLALLGMVMTAGCQQTTPGNAYADEILTDAAAATRTHLAQQAREPSRSQPGTVGRVAAAASTFSNPRILELEPCSVQLRFSYIYESSEKFGAADLEYDRTRRSWAVTRIWIIHEE
jgi:hypothetical protein